MAKTKVKFAHDTEGGTKMSIQAKGNAPVATGMPRQPAPDVISNPRSGGAGYGMSGGAVNPSRAPVGSVRSKLAQNLLDSTDDDGVLDHIIKNGTARQDDSITGQLRTIVEGSVPIHPAMSSAPKAALPGRAASVPVPKAAAPKASAANAQYNADMAQATKSGAKATPGQVVVSTKLS
jgi:hypothetical protein